MLFTPSVVHANLTRTTHRHGTRRARWHTARHAASPSAPTPPSSSSPTPRARRACSKPCATPTRRQNRACAAKSRFSARRPTATSPAGCRGWISQPDRTEILLDYLPGGCLDTLLERNGALSASSARFYVACAAVKLEFLHAKGDLVHRDVKPSNLVVDAAGYARLVDFGLRGGSRRASVASRCSARPSTSRPKSSSTRATPRRSTSTRSARRFTSS